ncbi:biotin--[acetyl-CoA-carboxylase] ligase [Pedobacter sp. HMF7647]|uniref:Biotin--[acetyl-CoA-carboxylase] ligase n=1 Tax=Hufsiella arboris TaxID=2695275 RepID=A0A7K1Y5F8_9SPHI|nr:biotin--[acetyl-CoA-carboxylase] ligase [Hufsiella arboris]MXV49825.1 biotin--[acetyl-CoA-carboxylase] ligase [Hufsiella arboris]
MQNNTFSRLFLGQNVVRLSKIDSTNSYLKEILSNSAPVPEGTVIMADEQFAGRGQSTNSWYSEPGKNLTVSLLLNPRFLSVGQQFLLNKAISTSINDVLRQIIGNEVKIKWPNDVYFKNSKSGGILIENIIQGNQWKYAIIGIGLNVNQIEFPDLERPVSSIKKILQEDYDLERLLAEICCAIEASYLKLRTLNFSGLSESYLERLYRFNELAMFKANDKLFEGTIVDVDDQGLLHIKTGEKISTYTFKEVEFIN